MKKYSFVVITYNSKNFIINCLESLNHQEDFSPDVYEVVVVDDGSNDGTYECIQKLNLSYSLRYIYIERTKKSCRNAARNRGWLNAKGEFVIFLDADMIVKKDYLKNLHGCYEINKDISVVGLRFMLDEPVLHQEVIDGSIFSKINIAKPEMKYYEERHYYFNDLSYNPLTIKYMWLFFYSCNICVPKKYLQLVGGFNEKLPGWGFDDQELGYRLTKAGVKLVLNQQLEGLHQYHGEFYGSVRSTERILEQLQNISIVYKLHPDLEKIVPKLKLLVYYTLRLVKRLNQIKKNTARKHQIHVKDINFLEEVKASIKELASSKGNEIVVYDHLENSDLHLWVQFLEETKSLVKYFPVSRILDKKRIKSHRRYLKKKYPTNQLLRCIEIFFLAYIKPLFIRQNANDSNGGVLREK